jgi:MinD-like ATPase involved in chromosome partitioning or flagellar assembly
MRPGFEDQAAGLRRLLHRAPPQVLSVVCCGPRAVSWLADQAKLKAAQGSSVVAFDELDCCGNLADALGVAPRFDLLQAVEREVSLEMAKQAVGRGLSLLSSARLARALPGADRRFAARLGDTCRRLQLGADLWLVHSRPGAGNGLSALAMAAHRMMVVVEGNARSVTEAYALLKQIRRGPWPQIDLAVVGGASVDETLVANLIDVVQQNTHLAVRRVRAMEACVAAANVVVGRRDERYLERVMVIAQRAPMALSV